MNNIPDYSKRRVVIVCIIILIAAAHIFRLGSYLQGPLYNFYYSYFSDLILPFGCYFLLCVDEQWINILRRWETKFAIAYLIPSMPKRASILEYQYWGLPSTHLIISCMLSELCQPLSLKHRFFQEYLIFG